jgi:hypothetical protein
MYKTVTEAAGRGAAAFFAFFDAFMGGTIQIDNILQMMVKYDCPEAPATQLPTEYRNRIKSLEN